MLFPTFNFLLFFLLVFALGWALTDKALWRKIFLTAASYFFYAFWDWRFAFLLFGSTLVNYAGGLLIARYAGRPGLRKVVLALTIAANLVTLGFFKYYEFFIQSLGDILHLIGWERDLPLFQVILPVGISFFTFQGISYVVDIYRGQIKARRTLLDVMLYISFFPQLVAGPIVRASDFMPQLQRRPDPNRVLVSMGLLLILWGLIKKSILANYLAIDLVDKVFLDPSLYSAPDVLLAVYGYAVQIYCDFSAYSDIAIGVAALLGYHFPRNFDQPYRASSIADFWRRWHISLSSWLRDYLYIPLGGNRGGRLKTYRNLMVTMLLGGLWHGAAWKFILWGGLHGGALALERLLTGRRGGVSESPSGQPGQSSQPGRFGGRWLRILLVFHFVCFCWIFFRANNLATVWEILGGLGRFDMPLQLLTPLSLILIAVGLLINFTPRDMLGRIEGQFDRWPLLVRGVICGLVVVVIEAFGMDGAAPFIYFQF